MPSALRDWQWPGNGRTVFSPNGHEKAAKLFYTWIWIISTEREFHECWKGTVEEHSFLQYVHFCPCNIRENGSSSKSINHHNYEILKALAFSTPLWSKLAEQKHSTWKFGKKIASPFSACITHHKEYFRRLLVLYFFLSAQFARKWAERVFCKKLHSFQRLQTGAMGNCGRKACFCCCCLILVTKWFRFWP